MKLSSRLFSSRKISLAAVSLLSLAGLASAAVPYADANPFERASFGSDWGILSNDIFFGGADALFGLSPASRTLLLFSAAESKSTSAALVTEASQEDLSGFASALESPFAYSSGGGFAPNAVTAIKQFDGGTAPDIATGTNTAWNSVNAWRPDNVPTSADDVLFDNAWRPTLQNVHLGGGSRVANSITLSLTTEQVWALGANSDANVGLAATLTLTSGNITRTNTTNNSINIIGATSGTGLLTGAVTTLATTATGFTITNLDTTGDLQIAAIISGATKTVTTVGPGTTIFSGANTYTGATDVTSGTLLVNGNQAGATGAVTVSNVGTVLGGTGTIGGAVDIANDASITGGTNGTVGTLTLTNSLTFTFGSYLVDLVGTTADRLNIGVNLDLSGALDQLTLNGTPDGTSSYILATYMSHSGEFDITNVPMNYQLIYGTDSLILAPIPEPSTWIGAALALAAIGFTQRRRLRGLVARGA